MNTEELILYRLLEAYPVAVVKHYFDTDAPRQDKLIELIIKTFSKEQIEIFAFEYFGFLHQHVYILDSNVPVLDDSLSLLNGFKSVTDLDGVKYYNFIYQIKYNYFSPILNGREELVFNCPFRITLYKNKLILMINTLERNIKNYFTTPIYSLGKNIDESDIIDDIKNGLPTGTTVAPVDLNKGIKKLWEDGFIDAIYSKYKRAKSTSTEVMDEENLLKITYPDRYKEIVKAPIDRTVFLVVDKGAKDVVSRFRIEPRIGKTTITRFPDGLSDLNNLIQKIIDNN